MDDDQQFCLRWNNHQSTLISVFDTLLEKGIHVDCTLAAEGQTLKAHKVVLSACSPYFENVLSQQYDKHPIIILKDVKYAELRAMMDYMYRGEVNISQDQLAALLKAAESLQIKGLSDNKPARPAGTHAPRQPSPSNKTTEGSAGSREGSASPSRRRKKARRASTDGILPTAGAVVNTVAVTAPVPLQPLPPPADEHVSPETPPAECKVEEGSRGVEGEGVEDLTLDEENEEPLPPHNDVVRNFQWHMERSQDELMNADGARDSQGSTAGKYGDHPLIKPKKVIAEKASSTFALLRNVLLPNDEVLSPKPDEDMEDKDIVKLPILPDDKYESDNTHTREVDNVAQHNVDDNTNVKEDPPKREEKIVKKRGRPPLNKNKNLADKPDYSKGKTKKSQDVKNKETKPSKCDADLARDKGKADENVGKKKDVADKEKSVYDFDYNSESSVPLPCSEYKTDTGYKCPNCDRCYNARKNLVRHVTLECGRDPQYQCPHCPHSKHRRNELKKHIQKKHSNEPDKAIKRRV